jgi:hypothetical protein
MNYQEFRRQMDIRMNSIQYKSYTIVRDAIRRCPAEEQAWMKDWAETLDRLPTMAEDEYEAVKNGLFQGLEKMASDYHAPGTLFADPQVERAMKELFSALELNNRQFVLPGFTIGDLPTDKDLPSQQAYGSMRRVNRDVPKATQALQKDPVGYLAQYMSYLNLTDTGYPSDLFRSFGLVNRWKKDPLLREIVKDEKTMTAFKAGDYQSVEDGFVKAREFVEKNSLSFKEYSDRIAKEYQARKINYAQLEARMQILRDLTKEAVGGEKDPVKRNKLQEEAMIFMPDFEAKLEHLEQAKTQEQKKAKEEKQPKLDPDIRRTMELRQKAEAAREYQHKLAAESPLSYEDKVRLIGEAYGAKPVFHPEYAVAKNTGYNQDNFEENLPEIDTSGFVLGGEAVSHEEFAALATLAVYDPEISGIHAIGTTGLVDIPADENVSISFHSHRVTCFGNSSTTINGNTVNIPDDRAGKFIATEIGPAREKVKEALEAYQKGELKPLAQIIAYGIRCGTDLSRHELSKRKVINADPRLTAEKDSPIYLTLTGDNVALERMMGGALALLARDDKLQAEARSAGLTKEQQEKAVGMQIGYQIVRAGETAMEKLLGAARGREQLSDFEKEQCIVALQRRNALLQSLQEHETEMQSALKTIDKAFDDRMNKIVEFYGEENLDKTPEARVAMQKAQAFWNRQALTKSGTPPVYKRLGQDGPNALDTVAAELQVDKEARKNMTSLEVKGMVEGERKRLRELNAFELAAEMGITARQTGKTTAQDIYDQLTKAYKERKLDYGRYEARLKTMRELTGGNKHMKIDLETIDHEIEVRKQESAKRSEEIISEMTGPAADYDGPLGVRLRGMYDVYGLTPRKNQVSIDNNGYTEEQFAKLEDFRKADSDQYLKIGPYAAPISDEDFAALSIAVTQTDPEIGGKFFAQHQDINNGVPTQIVVNPTLDNAINCRGFYTTDAYSDSKGARNGFGNHYLESVTVPARKKADEALRAFSGGESFRSSRRGFDAAMRDYRSGGTNSPSGRQKMDEALHAYNSGSGSAAELGKILGLGLHNMLSPLYLADKIDREFKSDCVLDGAVSGRLADIIERDEALKQEALKYTNKDELAMARGLKCVYDLTRGAQTAMKKLQDSATNNKPLPPEERNACIELVLRQRALVISARRHAASRENSAEMLEADRKYDAADRSTQEKSILAGMQQVSDKNRATGLPEFVKGLGIQGPGFAKALLDKVMPNREALFAKGDKYVMAELNASIGSGLDPFENKTYRKSAEEVSLGKGTNQKSAPEVNRFKTI